MSTTTELYYFSAVSQGTGEGSISTGLNPLEWGALGPTVINGTSSTTALSKSGAFTDYTWASGDEFVFISATGISTTTRTIASKTNANTIVLSSSPGASGSNIVGYIRRTSLAGAILDYPATLPAPDEPPNYLFGKFACYRPQDGLMNQQTKMLKFTAAKRVGDDVAIATSLATGTPDSLIASIGFRLIDFNSDGLGQYYTIQAALRNSGGEFGGFISRADVFADGGLSPSGMQYYYVQPGTIDGSLTLTVAQASDGGFGLNFAMNHQSGDAAEACSLLGINGPILRLQRIINDASSKRPRGRGRGRWASVR